MIKISSKLLTSFNYIYIIAFFTLLAGFFYPLITNTGFDNVVVGVMILLLGLAGGILLHRAATSDKRRVIFMASGFALMSVSLYYIFIFAERI